MKNKFFAAFMFVAVIIVYVLRFLLVKRGFNTFYDEASFLLSLQDAKNGIISGGSQWNHLAVKMFPFIDLTLKSNAYIINLCISLIAAVLLSVVTGFVHVRSYGIQHRFETWVCYFGVYLLVMMLFINDNQEFTYVSLQMLLFAIALSLFVISYSFRSLWKRRICRLMLGMVSVFSVFVILPSGICMLCCWALLIIIMEWKNPKEIVFQLLLFLIGVFFGLLLFHFCVANLVNVVEKMRETASSITTLHRGYDFTSFVSNICYFIRDFVMCFMMVIGAWFVHMKIANKGSLWRWLGYGLFLLLIITIYVYQKKPVFTESMLCMAIAAIPVFLTLTSGWTEDYNRRKVYVVFLFCFPLIASLGTNLSIGNRIGCFLFSWVLLYEELCHEQRRNIDRVGLYVIPIFVVIMLSQIPMIKSLVNDENAFQMKHNNTPMSCLYLKSIQVEFLDKVIDICEDYQYNPDSSIIFGFNEDLAALYVLGAKKRINPYGIGDFLYDHQYSHITQPDFIILPKRWINILKDSDRCFWSWEEYDVYDIGTPNPVDYLDTDKQIYCKKK